LWLAGFESEIGYSVPSNPQISFDTPKKYRCQYLFIFLTILFRLGIAGIRFYNVRTLVVVFYIILNVVLDIRHFVQNYWLLLFFLSSVFTLQLLIFLTTFFLIKNLLFIIEVEFAQVLKILAFVLRMNPLRFLI